MKNRTVQAIHPFAELFPMLDDAALEELAADIKANGLRQPIVMFEDKILDGRNRFFACCEAGVEPKTEKYTGDDPLGYVISLNLRRRHLDTSQRAVIAAKIATLRQGQHQTGKFAALPTQAEAAKMMKVSERSVRDGRKVLDQGDAPLITSVERGERAVSSAARSLVLEVRPGSGLGGAAMAPKKQTPAEEIARQVGYHLPQMIELLGDDFDEGIKIYISKGLVDRASIKRLAADLSYACISGSPEKKTVTRGANKYCDERGAPRKPH
jgi:hypothetical protein